MSVANVVETYEALTAVYIPKQMTAANNTLRNARSSQRKDSPGARHNDASPATSGRTPSPIVNAPAARIPSVNIRCLKNPVAISHCVDW